MQDENSFIQTALLMEDHHIAEINDQSQLPHHIELSLFLKNQKCDRKEKRKSQSFLFNKNS